MRKFATGICILAGIFLLAMCRKLEYPSNPSIRPDLRKQFLSVPNSMPMAFTRIAEKIRMQDSQFHFLNSFIDKHGLPSWQNAILVKNSGAANSRLDGFTDSLVLIPLVKSHDNYVHGFLGCIVKQDSVTIRVFNGNLYSAYGYTKGLDTLSAATVAATTMYLHHRVFSDTLFKINDTLLFKTPVFRGKKRSLVFNDNATGRLEVASSQYGCVGTSWEDDYVRVILTITSLCWDYTTWIDIIEPANVPWPSGTGIISGGGGDEGWWDEDPCRLAETIGGGATCGGGGSGTPGWTPLPINEPAPPPSDSTMAVILKRAYLKVQSKADSLQTAAQANGKERAFSYRVIHNDTVAYNIVQGDTMTSNPSTAPDIFGLNHTHQDNGLPANNSQSDRNQTFDTDDIFKFYSDHVFTAGSKSLQIQTLTTRDYVYAAYITDINLFKANMIAQAGTLNIYDMLDALFNKYDSIMNTCTTPVVCTYEKKSEMALLAIFGNNNPTISGIKFFKSPRNVINFTPLQ